MDPFNPDEQEINELELDLNDLLNNQEDQEVIRNDKPELPEREPGL